jgi:hypothetical protein
MRGRMSNATVRDQLLALQARIEAGDETPEEIGQAFERLTYSLVGVDADDDATLHGWVNDIDRIRFSLLPDDQMQAVADVLSQARQLFDRLA